MTLRQYPCALGFEKRPCTAFTSYSCNLYYNIRKALRGPRLKKPSLPAACLQPEAARQSRIASTARNGYPRPAAPPDLSESWVQNLAAHSGSSLVAVEFAVNDSRCYILHDSHEQEEGFETSYLPFEQSGPLTERSGCGCGGSSTIGALQLKLVVAMICVSR